MKAVTDHVRSMAYRVDQTGPWSRDTPLTYAMVITVQSKAIPDLYNQVVRKYATQLEP